MIELRDTQGLVSDQHFDEESQCYTCSGFPKRGITGLEMMDEPNRPCQRCSCTTVRAKMRPLKSIAAFVSEVLCALLVPDNCNTYGRLTRFNKLVLPQSRIT
jgi:hypothetical protein